MGVKEGGTVAELPLLGTWYFGYGGGANNDRAFVDGKIYHLG